jgi:hypothetical protein
MGSKGKIQQPNHCDEVDFQFWSEKTILVFDAICAFLPSQAIVVKKSNIIAP